MDKETQVINPYALGVFEFNGQLLPVAVVLAKYTEARAAFQNEIEEMEEELSAFLAKNPHMKDLADKKAARISRLIEIEKAYLYFQEALKADIKALQHKNATLRNGGYSFDDIAPRRASDSISNKFYPGR